MSSPSYTEKLLRVTFVLSNNAVFVDSKNTLTLAGLRVLVKMKGSGLPTFPELDMSIFGMAPSDMNALAALTFQTTGVNRNTVTVEANSGNGYSVVFTGQIISAVIDYAGVPEVALVVSGRMLGYESINPANATSFTGATDVAQIVQGLAARMGYAFSNNGVTTQLSSPYLPGTLGDQLKAVCQAANVTCILENNLITITPNGVPLKVTKFILTPANGLTGYPQIDSRGYIQVRSLYNPAFRFGGPLTIQGSDVVIDPNAPATLHTRADGDWVIGTIAHTLESKRFGGAWFTDMLLYPPGNPPPTA